MVSAAIVRHYSWRGGNNAGRKKTASNSFLRKEMSMKVKYRLFVRKGGMFYAEDVETRKQTSLGTKDRKEALRLLHAKNESHRAPSLNLQMGHAYLSATDPFVLKRDWQRVEATAGEAELASGLRRVQGVLPEAFKHMADEGGRMPMDELLVFFKGVDDTRNRVCTACLFAGHRSARPAKRRAVQTEPCPALLTTQLVLLCSPRDIV